MPAAIKKIPLVLSPKTISRRKGRGQVCMSLLNPRILIWLRV